MKTRTKALLLALCAVVLVVATVFGTVAYLTDTEEVVNTFTVGSVAIKLDEAKVDEYGVAVQGADRVQANAYKLIPGHTYTKDPTVHVDAASEDCWLFVKVVDEIAEIQDTKTVAAQMNEKGWTAVAGAESVFAYQETVKGGDDVVVFENFKIKGDVSNEMLADYANKTITVTAYAIQADGFETSATAWTAFGAQKG